MKPFLFLIALVCFSNCGVSQGVIEIPDKPFVSDTKRIAAVDDWLEKFSVIKNQSTEEQEVYYWINVVRSRPQQFLEDYVEPFLKQFPEAKGGASRSLVSDLKAQTPLPFLEPRQKLINASHKHAKDLAVNTNYISHNSSDGKSFSQRMAAEGITNCAGENILIGKSNALLAVIMLLIDEGVSNRGHRKAILSPKFETIGASFYSRKDGLVILDQIFSCK